MDRAQAIMVLLRAAAEASLHVSSGKEIRRDAVDALNALDVSDSEITAALRQAWAEEAGR